VSTRPAEGSALRRPWLLSTSRPPFSFALEEIGHLVHQADLADNIYDAPEAPGLDVLIRGLTLTSASDHDTLTIASRLFDGPYEHVRRRLITGRPPA
jgi:hypothetical protein